MYGVLRYKRGYKSYKPPKKRPDGAQLIYVDSNGIDRDISLSWSDFPGTYLVVDLPVPGVLTGAHLSDRNPELQLSVIGDPIEIQRALTLTGGRGLSLTNYFSWGDFCRVLAKIAHGYLVANVGSVGYKPFLPDLILGHSPYLSHYVGGLAGGGRIHMMSHYLTLEVLPGSGITYLVVNIHLLGGLEMPTYQVVAAELMDFSLLKNNASLSIK